MRTTLTGIFALAAELVLPLPGFGQTVGDITGSVTDASGGVAETIEVTGGAPLLNTEFPAQAASARSSACDRASIMRELQFSLKVVF